MLKTMTFREHQKISTSNLLISIEYLIVASSMLELFILSKFPCERIVDSWALFPS